MILAALTELTVYFAPPKWTVFILYFFAKKGCVKKKSVLNLKCTKKLLKSK